MADELNRDAKIGKRKNSTIKCSYSNGHVMRATHPETNGLKDRRHHRRYLKNVSIVRTVTLNDFLWQLDPPDGLFTRNRLKSRH